MASPTLYLLFNTLKILRIMKKQIKLTQTEMKNIKGGGRENAQNSFPGLPEAAGENIPALPEAQAGNGKRPF